ncbi:MAG: MarR family winged helix-turn-helix transcriptional regulator [Desulfovibrio sp.]|jgi:DNA-binding MarR family transcriptional regulator|nr:MarR family winged helix-turn-helix transcriptional regulator [Desulfovibrio sp.]
MKFSDAAETACYCTTFRKAARELTALYDAALEPAGLRVTQYSLLKNLQRLGPVSILRLCDALRLDRTTLVRNLKLLEKRGLTHSDTFPASKAHIVVLTEKGERLLSEAAPLWLKAQTEVHKNFSGEERLSLQGFLRRLETVAL